MVGMIGELPEDDGSGGGGGGGYTPPAYESGDWARIADLAAGRTEYRSINFAVSTPAISVNLNGVYNVTAVTADTITLAAPELVNDDWLNFTDTAYASPSLSTQGEGWVGPFIIDQPGMTQIVANYYAPQGMYLVTEKGKDRPRSVQVRLEATPLDANGNPSGATQVFTATISGDGKDKAPKGVTLTANVAVSDKYRVRSRRLTDKDYDSKDTIVDEVKWRDCFGTSAVVEDHFGDVTTVYTRTYATSGATAVKERKLNCRATRKVLQRNADDTFGPALVPSKNAADILCHMALDPVIGGRTLNELDVPQIYETLDEVIAYFGINEAGQFCYTFDQENISFEEMVQSVAQAVFCTAYRQGSKLRLFFERATEDSTLLFNHRNKVPGSERRTIRFGHLNDHDGVELDYVSPVDGAKLTIYIPEDRSAVKPKKVELIGVQSEEQGLLHANRLWNKICYQHTSTEFNALGEATQLVLNERIEVADNTRPDVFDGHVISQDGLILRLTQPFVAKPGVEYVIYLQHPDGGIEVIGIEPGTDEHHVVLQDAPSFAVLEDPEVAADTLYQIVGDDSARTSAFLLTEKGPYDKRSLQVTAINYDHRYYAGDGAYR